jgi:pimeloyl-ACP methyl ester carboxylesterase
VTTYDEARRTPRYTVHGEADTTLFMLHGAYGDGRYFDDVVCRFTARGLRVVVWTCPGYGPEPVPEGFGMPLLADFAATMIRREATRTNVLLGHSMGGLIAPRVPPLTDGLVHGLILSASSAGFVSRTPEDKARYLAERVKPITDDGLSVAEYADRLLTKMMAPGAAGRLVDRVREVVREMKTESFIASMTAITEYDSIASLRAVAVPTLLIAGRHDTATPASGMRRIQELIPGSEYHEVQEAGHYSFAEAADEFERVVTDFVGSIAPTPTAV